MTVDPYAITFDSTDALRLAEFWAAALGRVVDDGATADFASIGLHEDASARPHFMFMKVPEGKTAKNRVHLDLITTDLEDEAERLVGLGARRGDEHREDGARWVTFADPDGNEFDVVLEA
jgi:predicted enzyme related to lactoylglutathione lyase